MDHRKLWETFFELGEAMQERAIAMEQSNRLQIAASDDKFFAALQIIKSFKVDLQIFFYRVWLMANKTQRTFCTESFVACGEETVRGASLDVHVIFDQSSRAMSQWDVRAGDLNVSYSEEDVDGDEDENEDGDRPEIVNDESAKADKTKERDALMGDEANRRFWEELGLTSKDKEK